MTMFPIKCLVEAIDDDQCPQCSKTACGSMVLSDSYAIVAGQTPLSQLTDTVLAALGLQHMGYGSKATLQFKNWKPLTFDQITDEPDTEIESILKDVSNHLTLRILTKQPGSIIRDGVNDLKDRLLRAILQKVPTILSDAQQTLWKEFLSQLAFSDVAFMGSGDLMSSSGNISALNAGLKSTTCSPWLEDWSKKCAAAGASMAQVASFGDDPSSSVIGQNGFGAGATGHKVELTRNGSINGLDSVMRDDQAVNGSAAAMTRFNPLLEVPKLERWFRESANPSRQKLQQYLNALNATNFRKHNAKITYQQICNWFINARATTRRRNIKMNAAIGQRLSDRTVASHSVNPNGTPWSNKSISRSVHRNQQNHAGNRFSHSTPIHPNQNAIAIPNEQVLDEAVKTELNVEPVPNVNVFQVLEHACSSKHESTTPSPASALEIDETAHIDKSSEQNMFIENGCIEESQQKQSAILKNGSLTQLTSEIQVTNLNEDKCYEGSACSSSSPAPPSEGAQIAGCSPPLSGKSGCPAVNRSRLMFDPLSELPMLEKWFEDNPHPSWVQIDQITDTLNALAYRHTYPRVSSHNVKIWFKNRRAKCKRNLMASETGCVGGL